MEIYFKQLEDHINEWFVRLIGIKGFKVFKNQNFRKVMFAIFEQRIVFLKWQKYYFTNNLLFIS